MPRLLDKLSEKNKQSNSLRWYMSILCQQSKMIYVHIMSILCPYYVHIMSILCPYISLRYPLCIFSKASPTWQIFRRWAIPNGSLKIPPAGRTKNSVEKGGKAMVKAWENVEIYRFLRKVDRIHEKNLGLERLFFSVWSCCLKLLGKKKVHGVYSLSSIGDFEVISPSFRRTNLQLFGGTKLQDSASHV